MCGIFGIYARNGYNAAPEILGALNALQHRGQDSAGIVTFDQTFQLIKGKGLVNDLIKGQKFTESVGAVGLGHVRYSTMGTPSEINAQPFIVNYPMGIAMVHNGNVTNFNELRKSVREINHRLVMSANDVELILYALAAELETKNLFALTADDVFDAVATTQNRIEGAYSALAIIADVGFLAFNDPHGIRPVVMGRKLTDAGPVYAFASETTCFDYLSFEFMRDLAPGEVIFIDKHHQVHSRILTAKPQHFCIFEYIYFAREDSIIHSRSVAHERSRMGQLLAQEVRRRNLSPDVVIDVPSSAFFFAEALANAINVPYARGLAKNNFFGRSFIQPTIEMRQNTVRQKLNPIRRIISGKKVAVVDDSIVRGTTSKHIVHLLREAGAREVYFISASPPIKYPCVYGIDMSDKTQLIASAYSEAEIANLIGADEVIYQKIEDLISLYPKEFACYACFNGDYPTKISIEGLQAVAKERLDSNIQFISQSI
ncbi:MAG: amidophosphoribosyltransferase [Oligoflexia bacterium]|nr:amidophosphoribosyltransferase [Oligoflexia bacterium]